jgi:hypothetical protein
VELAVGGDGGGVDGAAGGLAEVGADEAGLDEDDLDAEAAELEAQGVADRLERVLGGVVVAAAGEGRGGRPSS